MNSTVFLFSLDVYQDSGIFQKIFLISLFLLISRNSMGNLFKSKILLYTAQGHHNCISSAFRQNSEYLFIVYKLFTRMHFHPSPLPPPRTKPFWIKNSFGRHDKLSFLIWMYFSKQHLLYQIINLAIFVNLNL